MWAKFKTGSHSVQPPLSPALLGGGIEPPTGPLLLEGGCWESGGEFFRGFVVLTKKTKI